MNDFTKPEKPPIGINPRHFWLKERIKECIAALSRLENTGDWDLYLKNSLDLANEIKYAAEEWNKYYYE